LKQGKDLEPGRLGISLPLETLYTADSVIPAVRPQSPAYKAGFRRGDRIVAMDGRSIGLAVEVRQELSRRYAGDKIRIAVARGKERIEREVELVAKLDPYRQPFLGVLPMRPRSGDKAPRPSGIRVRYVLPGSPVAKAGLQPGDALVAVGGTKVKDVPQVRSRLMELQPGDRVPVEFVRGSESRRVEVTLADLPEGLPAGPLPPAREPGKPAEGKRPQVGAIQLKVPDLAGETWCYVPENYDPAVPHGILFWLPPPGEIKPHEILTRWKAHCDQDGLILVVPKSLGPVRWQRLEARIIPPLAAQIAAQYAVDANRVVVYGRQTAGAVAVAAAFRYPQLVRAVVALDAPAEGQIPENDPGHRLAFYLGWAKKAAMAGAVRETAGTLRRMRYPVTEKDLGEKSRELSREELAELARWIDTLDRI
jgi:serine protease Do